MASSNLTIHTRSHNNNKFKISVPTWNGKFELLDGSVYISDI